MLEVCESGIDWSDSDVAAVLGAFFWGIFFSEVIGRP